MSFTAKDVQSLREKTGSGMMDCKKALTEAGGDIEKATEILREKGLAAMAKKSGRIAAEGVVRAYTDDAKGISALIEINSETDFVAKNEIFLDFVDTCAKTVVETTAKDVDELLTLKASGTDMTVAELLQEKFLTIGENLKIRRFERLEGVVSTYIHAGGKIGVAVTFDTSSDMAAKAEFKAAAKDVAMQIAAATPLYVAPAEVPSDIIEKEKEILMAQAMNEGKPQNIAEKMVEGRIKKYYKDACLLEQPFIKDGDFTVSQYIENTAKELGGDIKVVSFVRYEQGEGLEKRSDNFAEEVANMVN